MKTIEHSYDFVVIGGGLAGICAAVTAARNGTQTALVQDRPVLGGNASTEIRVPPVGATQCNFAYSRETGLIEELFLNNLLRNPTWCSEGWNLELENLVRNEANLELFLNCAVCEVATNAQENPSSEAANLRVVSVKAYCSMAETWHVFHAPYFADCSGDGVVAAQAGAVYRFGVEARTEFDEPMCPSEPNQETMGMSLHLHARNAGRPLPFVKPAWVNLELNAEDFGPYRPVSEHFFPDTGGFWWLEWGGELDTVHDTLKIKDEIQRLTLAVWDYLKNRSPIAEKLRTYELDWMGAVPGKRESRRFEGDHILTMGDIDAQVQFTDAVAYGGWGFDHHPPGGFYDKVNPSTHQYLRGPHNIPLRSLYSRNLNNLFLAGRNISATHYALSSTRVMLTCAQLGEAVGMAAVHAVRLGCETRELAKVAQIAAIQQDLFKTDHHIHALAVALPQDIAVEAQVSASSVCTGLEQIVSWGTEPLTGPRMQLLPVVTEHVEALQLLLDANATTQLSYRFMQGPPNASTFPDRELMAGTLLLQPGENQWVTLPIACDIAAPGWHFLIVDANPLIRLHVTESPPGLLRYYPRPEDPIRPNPHSSWTLRSLPIGQQKATDADGAEVLAPIWNDYAQQHRDISNFLGFSFACRIYPNQAVYEPKLVVNPHSRPSNLPNLWVSGHTAFHEPEWIDLEWDEPRNIASVQVLFDSALQVHFGQSWQGYAVNAIPSIVKDYRIIAHLADDTEVVIAVVTDNHQRNNVHHCKLDGVRQIRLECAATHGLKRAQVYSLRVFEHGTEIK
jgi:FAD dependent oxidoreductase